MNPLSKAIGAVLVLAAGTLGASLEETPLGGLPSFNPPGRGGDDAGDGNGTADGNETDGNGTAGGNQTAEGNETADGNGTAPDGNETAEGNATADNGTAEEGNETADPPEEAEPTPEERSAACSFHLDESSNDLSPEHHEWEWVVTRDVQHLWVFFRGYEGVPTGLGDQSSVRLIDGNGRTVAHSSSGDHWLEVYLERGVDAMSDGTWRLVYESDGALGGHHVQVGLDCDKA